MLKFSGKISFLFAFCTLYFLYNLCSIFCFAVEDYFGEYTRPCFLIGDDYWSSIGKMFLSGILVFYFRKRQTTNSFTIAMTQILYALLIFVVAVHISQVVSTYFDARETWADFWILLINVAALLLYALIVYLAENSEVSKTYTYVSSGIFAICFITAFCLATNYMPRTVVKSLRQDKATADSVRYAVDALKSSTEVPSNLPDTVKVKDEHGKRTISYEFKTDFEKLKRKGIYTRHLRKKINIAPVIYKQGERVGEFTFKKGTHSIEVLLSNSSK